jgi:hypothetical protein
MNFNTTLPTTSSSLQFENTSQKEREEGFMNRRKIYCPTKEGLISWSFHVSVCLGTGAPTLLLKTFKWGMASRPAIQLSGPFGHNLS